MKRPVCSEKDRTLQQAMHKIATGLPKLKSVIT